MSHIKISAFAILVSAMIVASGSIFFTSISAQVESIPTWVKSIAGWWSEGKISDAEYLNATQFLVQNGIIKIPMIIDLQNKVISLQSQVDDDKQEIVILKNQLAAVQSSNSSTSSSSQATNSSSNTIDLTTEKGIATAWVNNQITDSQYIAAMQTLIDQGKVLPYTETEYNNMLKTESGTQRPAYNATVDQYNPNQPVPSVLKNEAGFWVRGDIDYQTYRLAVMYHLFQWGFLRNP